LMTVFVFLAAYAKAQDRNQSTWKKVEYAMLALYILALIPCYIFSAKFFDVQFDKENIMKQVNKDTSDLDKLFADYNRKCESRASAYQIDLEALMTTPEGRARIAELTGADSPSSVNKNSIDQIVSSFSKSLKGSEYNTLNAEKNKLVKNCEENFNNWNIMFIPKYAYELGMAKSKYASDLERIYGQVHNNIERNIPEFDAESYMNESNIIETFRSAGKFSVIGLLVVLFLGFLGLVKYLLGDKSTVIPMKVGSSSIINDGGGYTF
ncbi:MAG: hypothetical protein K2N91_08390, partial [Muribaculaceae bacterium]|nr:hypothetical protein [Muribaculaceae bacterium]